MCNLHNISSETINCHCCKDEPDAKIPNDVMELINNDLIKDGFESRPWHYWICIKRLGILSSIMEDLIRKKSDYKNRGLSLEEKAVKLFANSGYGTFGQVHFEYYDFRVAELITGFARRTLLELEQLLKENGFKILYGDTDSLFVKKVDNINGDEGGDSNCSYGYRAIDITTMAKERFKVEFSKDKVWKVLVLLNNKKQYFGILDDEEVCYKKLVGLKNNYPPFFNDVVSNLISKETIELFSLSPNVGSRNNNNKEAKKHVSDYLRSAFNILSDNLLVSDMKFIVQKLYYSAKTQKALYEHEHKRNCWQKYIFDEKIEDCDGDRTLAEMNCGAKSIHSFWKIVPNGRADNKKCCTTHPELNSLDVDTYKKELWNCIEPIIQAYGFSSDECITLRNELVNN
jgi:DNA polymerase elongation subunit (family B)